jgi:hypothetical protein
MCNGKELRSDCEDQSQAKIKEDKVIERLKRHEFPKMQGPEVKPHGLTGEQRFFHEKDGRRGLFGGVILNMHMRTERSTKL